MASHDASKIPADSLAKFCDEMEEVKEIMAHNLDAVKERGQRIQELKTHTKELEKDAALLDETTGGTPHSHGQHHHSPAAEHVKELISQVEEVEQVMEKNLERIHERGERLDHLEATMK